MLNQEKIAEILKRNPENYVQEISEVLKNDSHNTLKNIAFCLDYVAYSLNEELLLHNYKLLEVFTVKDWQEIVSQLKYVGKYDLLNFLSFHTNFSNDYLQKIGFKSFKRKIKETDLLRNDLELLTNKHPKVLKLYKKAGLNTNDIIRLHSMEGK